MKLKKFGSPKLDTRSLRYEFLKHAFKSMKNNLENQHYLGRQVGPVVNGDPHVRHTQAEHGTDRP